MDHKEVKRQQGMEIMDMKEVIKIERIYRLHRGQGNGDMTTIRRSNNLSPHGHKSRPQGRHRGAT